MRVIPCVQTAIDRLERAGYACHVVGGCVRDSLLGLTPHDWDLTTNALPNRVAELFAEFRVIPTGIQHGTVTVMIDGVALEITTYRTDGAYRDHRHPDGVYFVSDITDDLRREGLVRDLVRGIQNLRKESGLSVTDRIVLKVGAGAAEDAGTLREACTQFADFICGETLAENLRWEESLPDGAQVEAGETAWRVALEKA